MVDDKSEPNPILPQDLALSLAKRLAPLTAQELAWTPVYCGKKQRVHEGKGGVLVNTLFNFISGDVYIGDNVFFGLNVCVLTGTHSIDNFDVERQQSVSTSGRDIHIRRGPWISTNALLLLLDHAASQKMRSFGVGSVVTGGVRAGYFYAGTPARPIKPVAEKYVATLDEDL